MASFITLWLISNLYLVSGATLHKQSDKLHTVQTTRNIHRGGNIVKRSCCKPTFVTESVGRKLQREGNPVFVRAIQQNQDNFLDSKMTTPFSAQMKEIFDLKDKKWRQQQTILVKLCNNSRIRSSSTAEEFYRNILLIYTEVYPCYYKSINSELRNYNVVYNNSLGSFGLMLNVVLSHWGELTSFNDTSYRGKSFTGKQISEYSVNTSFAWTGFTSSSRSIIEACTFAKTVMFVIDNSAASKWQPKTIEKFSLFPSEQECLYPATAVFEVTRKSTIYCPSKGNIAAIFISLKPDPDDPPVTETSIGMSVRRSGDDPPVTETSIGMSVRRSGGTVFLPILVVIAAFMKN